MKRGEVIYKTKSFVIANPGKQLSEALNNSKENEVLLSSLLYASGFSYINIENKGGKVVFLAGNSKVDITEKFIFHKNNKEVTGLYKAEINQVYAIIDMIENRLASIMMYPMDMRINRISMLCEEMGVNSIDYEKVLRNWN
ncbi:hypothetical protein [Paenibacillus sp. An7]|uniref:hypothetical protein n=1 Tax=Paenibacillus sp. An7 TaxID=2689577 RepID=UPI001358EC57|nr:hypothetical protein [Paenibacillus sp. An7]